MIKIPALIDVDLKQLHLDEKNRVKSALSRIKN